jgi:hypothetical protein
MKLLIFVLFILIAFIALLPDRYMPNISLYKRKIDPKYFYYGFGVVLILICGLRVDSVDRDYLGYIDRFHAFSGDWTFKIEPSFILISKIVKNLFNSNIIILFVIYAILGISTKFYAIKQLSQFWALSLLVYLSYIFTLQDMTQIRVGVSTGVILLSFKPLFERKALKYFFFSIIAILFHYSAIIALFFWFLNPKNINKFLFLSLIPISYAIHYLTIVDSELLRQTAVFSPLMSKFLAYQYMNGSYINIFNSWQLMRIGLAALFIWKIELITRNNRYGIIMTKLFIFSICVYPIMSFNPAYASRFSDLFAISDIILIPCISYIFRPSIFAKLLIVFVAFSYLFLNLFYNKILS